MNALLAPGEPNLPFAKSHMKTMLKLSVVFTSLQYWSAVAGFALAYVPLPYAAVVLYAGLNPSRAIDEAAASDVPWYAVMTAGAAPRLAAISVHRASNAVFIAALRILKMALTQAFGEPRAFKNVASTVSYSLLNGSMSATSLM